MRCYVMLCYLFTYLFSSLFITFHFENRQIIFIQFLDQ